ncbi:hypothetical protein DAEQUDRAFT_329762 [Daedalea quercina L-15889]|uniref:Uncharacterized protein n=1 Tax=Daedalea quercina L-15889 TaxID=1314783 RepID=A0A165PQG7_9APHY|nr:hypothetical protein DAEQUDRAFT_329762 [Daedalea quercina L-15889]
MTRSARCTKCAPSYVVPTRLILSSHPPRTTVNVEDPNNSPLTMSERIFSLCFQSFATSSALNSMRTCLEQDLLASGVSHRDANIVLLTLASALDRSTWTDEAWYCASLATRGHIIPPPYYERPRVLAFLGDVLFIVGTITVPLKGGTMTSTYAKLIQEKAAVAAVLRAKFRGELEASNSAQQ